MPPTVSKNTLQAAEQITRDDRFWHDDFFSEMGQARSVSYAYSSDPGMQLTADQIVFFEQAFSLWADVANISFQRQNPAGYTNNATILVRNYFDANDPRGAAATPPGGALDPGREWDEADGDIRINMAN